MCSLLDQPGSRLVFHRENDVEALHGALDGNDVLARRVHVVQLGQELGDLGLSL